MGDHLLPERPSISPTDQNMRARVLTVAQQWIGTPYRHQGYTHQVGCDCLGLIRGVWISIYGREPETPRPYAKDWAERSEGELMFDAAVRHFGLPIELSTVQPGDLLLFRWRKSSMIKHAGILLSLIHI